MPARPSAGSQRDPRALPGRPRAHVRRLDATLLTKHADIRAVLVADGVSADTNRPGFPHASETARSIRIGQHVFARMDAPTHTEHRRMVNRDFLMPHVRALRPRLETHGGRDARQAGDTAAARGPGGRIRQPGTQPGSSSNCLGCRRPTADSSRIGWKSGIRCRAPRRSRRRPSRTSPTISPTRSPFAGKTPATT